ncbi:MAG: hypothetical protein KZQ77_04115 [Candidatus Thiodiazotropha sp. (ex Notomyrtea botanica)]|nr:hypothetical protein [Candidatus Thiodiazotropha sp. (ex Notomyrtea botanica)]
MDIDNNKNGIILGIILLVPAILALAISFNTEPESNIFKFTNIAFMLYIGVLFLSSYYYSNKTFVLRGLKWVCVHLSWPSSEKMAFFYFGLSMIMSTIATLDALGIV